MRSSGVGRVETAGSRKGRGLCNAGWRGGTLVDKIFDIQLGDRTEERVVKIDHLDDHRQACCAKNIVQDSEAVEGFEFMKVCQGGQFGVRRCNTVPPNTITTSEA